MQISLYKAAESVRNLLEQIDAETGELPEGFEQARAVVATKSQAVAAFILENEAVADMAEARAKEILASVKQARKRSDYLRGYLSEHMKACGITEIKADDGTFKASLAIDRDKSVTIFEPALLPADYMREIPAKQEPDKVLIKKAIDDGFDVPGARIDSKDRLTLK